MLGKRLKIELGWTDTSLTLVVPEAADHIGFAANALARAEEVIGEQILGLPDGLPLDFQLIIADTAIKAFSNENNQALYGLTLDAAGALGLHFPPGRAMV